MYLSKLIKVGTLQSYQHLNQSNSLQQLMISGRRVDSTSNTVKIITSNVNSKRTTSPLPSAVRSEQSSSLTALTQQQHTLLLAPPMHVSKANEPIQQCRNVQAKVGKGDGVENKQKTSNLLHKDVTVVNEMKGKTVQKGSIHQKQVKAKPKPAVRDQTSIKNVAASIAKSNSKKVIPTKKQQQVTKKIQEEEKRQSNDKKSQAKGMSLPKQQEMIDYQEDEFEQEVERMTMPMPIAAPIPQTDALEQVSFQNCNPIFPSCPIDYQSSDQEQSNLLANDYSFLPVQLVTQPDEGQLQLNMDLFSLSADQLMALDYLPL